MSKTIARIVALGYSELANDLYDFVKSRGQLPDEETVLQILKGSTDFNEIGNQLNHVFLECTREALLNAVSQENREKVRAMLLIREDLHEDSTQDQFEIRFLDRTLGYVDTAVLDDFYFSLQRYERDYLANNLTRKVTFSLEAPNQLIDSLLAIEGLNTFLYQTAVEPTDNREHETYILHQGLIRQLWRSQEVSFEKLSQLHSLIRPYMGRLRENSVTHPFNAEFIVINVKA
ncbi:MULTISPECIES: hypothetical protein [Entomomonas]|uniref:Uncharacterized protein n=1 Tax=Entomomonas asaccharolytica TaxID=2785331 RepID=A0A974NHV1_9GAMM|nr:MULTISPECIES: hypothetical protein [Entomomonas]QQP86881.1 hypothetical protein JHT90_06460 [Entomomonas asaccharolytica]UYZ83501.1 hypothetical protein MTZ49_12995 [Entomomonas sp. E2T0]